MDYIELPVTVEIDEIIGLLVDQLNQVQLIKVIMGIDKLVSDPDFTGKLQVAFKQAMDRINEIEEDT